VIEKTILSQVWWEIVPKVRASSKKPLIMVLPVFQSERTATSNPALELFTDLEHHVKTIARADHHVRNIERAMWYGHFFENPALGAFALSLYASNLKQLAQQQGKKNQEQMAHTLTYWALEQFKHFAIESFCTEEVHVADALVLGIFGRSYRVRKGTERFSDKVVRYLVESHDFVPYLKHGQQHIFPDKDPIARTHVLELLFMIKPID
jgi:hypothetical protein